MIEVTEGRESVVHGGRHFTLVSETWTIGISGPGFGLGWSYHHPHQIESGDGSTSIHDYLFFARLVAALLLIAAALTGTNERA
ncbi:MAG: hypothetical protein OER12_06545 [Acidimicrobiia bacterium]|nr:hypothetical protein [Acidimicrobiia bacterium]